WREGVDDSRRARWADRQTAGAVASLLDAPPSLERLPELARAAARELAGIADRGSAAATIEALEEAARAGERLVKQLDDVERQAPGLFDAIDFPFLFDPPGPLLSLGHPLAYR